MQATGSLHSMSETLKPKTNILAIVALILGGIAFLTGWIPVIGLLFGAAAIVFAVFALIKAQSKVMAIIGGAAGAIGAITSIIVLVIVIATTPLLTDPERYTAATPKPSPSIAPTPTPSATPTPTPTKKPAEPDETEAPAASALDEITAAQFLALAWEDKMIYGGTVHWIVDRITTVNDDGTYTFKIGATVENAYGNKFDATIEGDVGGTSDAPVIIDSIMYTDTGEIINYYG